MPMVTLIGEKLAEKDTEFTYIGPNNDCRNCKLKTVCFNLKIGRKYKIIGIRDKRHSCNVHDGNAAVVEVQELPLLAAIDKNLKKGTKTKIELRNCINIGCENLELCNNPAIKKDKECEITKVFEEIKCPIGQNLQKAEISY